MRGALGDSRDGTGSVGGARRDAGALPQTFLLDYTGFLQSNLVFSHLTLFAERFPANLGPTSSEAPHLGVFRTLTV